MVGFSEEQQIALNLLVLYYKCTLSGLKAAVFWDLNSSLNISITQLYKEVETDYTVNSMFTYLLEVRPPTLPSPYK